MKLLVASCSFKPLCEIIRERFAAKPVRASTIKFTRHSPRCDQSRNPQVEGSGATAGAGGARRQGRVDGEYSCRIVRNPLQISGLRLFDCTSEVQLSSKKPQRCSKNAHRCASELQRSSKEAAMMRLGTRP